MQGGCGARAVEAGLVRTTLVLGGPGTGKTERLIREVSAELTVGTPPDRIAYVSFTRAAADEATTRTCREFYRSHIDFPHFRTIHSLCFKWLGLAPEDVVSLSHLREFGERVGLEVSGRTREDEAAAGPGARLMFLDGLARNTGRPMLDAWREDPGDATEHEVAMFEEAYAGFKRVRGLLDFTDMLERCAGNDGFRVLVDVAIIDEAQDLTPLQWAVADRAFAGARRMVVAGDDDQAIYEWSGADVERFLSMVPDETVNLERSHRLPAEIAGVAAEVAAGMRRRRPKTLVPDRPGGEVVWSADPAEADLSSGTWLLLARNTAFLPHLEEECQLQGVTYTVRGRPSVDPEDVKAVRAYEHGRTGERLADGEVELVAARMGIAPESYRWEIGRDRGIWHDAFTAMPARRRAYYLSVLRAGRKLTTPPNVRIDTIHSVKGGEAENVMLLTDLARRTEEHMWREPDAEARVWYVGVTRARERLMIVQGMTGREYRF